MKSNSIMIQIKKSCNNLTKLNIFKLIIIAQTQNIHTFLSRIFVSKKSNDEISFHKIFI